MLDYSAALQDLRSQSLVRLVSDDLDELMQQALLPLKTEDFELSVYFGRNSEKQYDKLSLQLLADALDPSALYLCP